MSRPILTQEFVLPFVLALLSGVTSTTVSASPVRLEPRVGARIEARLAAGETKEYVLALPAGYKASVSFDQSAVDLVIEVAGDDASPSYLVASFYDRALPEELFLASAGDEVWRLTVEGRGPGISGPYAVEIDDLSIASPLDLERAAVEARYWTLLRNTTDQSYFQRMQKEVEKHVETAREIIAVQKTAGDGRREAEAAFLLADLLLTQGRRDRSDQLVNEALQTLQAARAAAASSHFELLEPHLLWYEAEISGVLDRGDAAERLRADALESARKLGSGTVAARVLNLLGTRYRDTDPERAIGYYTEAIELWTANGDALREAFGQHNMAGAYRNLGKVEEAVGAVEKAITTFRQLGQNYYAAAASVAVATGLSDLGRDDEGIARLREAIAFAKEHDLGSAIVSNQIALARLLTKTGRHDEALAVVADAEPLAKVVGGLDALLREKAVSDLKRGRVDDAIPFLARDVDEAERGMLGSIRAVQQSWKIANERSKYDIYVEALLVKARATGDDSFLRRAFEISEKGRSRALLQQLAASGFNPTQHVPGDLASRSRELQRELGVAAQRRNASSADVEASKDATRKIEDLSRQMAELDSRIAESNPDYGNLTRQPVSLSMLQSMLDAQTAVLYYSLDYHEALGHSHLWVITRNSVDVLDLAKRADLAAAVAEYRAELDRVAPSARGLTAVDGSARALRETRTGARLAAHLLHPAHTALATFRRIVIVPEGAVQYAPFAALPESRGGQRLINRHEIAIVPSASVLVALRNRIEAREPAEKGVRVFADPVFSRSDVRLARVTKDKEILASHNVTQRAAEASGLTRAGEIGRLPHTRKEAERIRSVAGSDATIALSFAATKVAALSADVGSYRVVHFATHAFVDDQHPELSGMLLSHFDALGSPIDGFLRLNDIYSLRLNADLVVLSGCRTGLGKDVRGEGLIGLTRGFMYAGAPRVMVTLWSVDDEATSRLMGHFYENFLKKKMTPVAALREAQRRMSRTQRWGDPFYWAGFVIQGDWK